MELRLLDARDLVKDVDNINSIKHYLWISFIAPCVKDDECNKNATTSTTGTTTAKYSRIHLPS